MIKKILIFSMIAAMPQFLIGFEKKWWQKWDNFPDVPTITAAQAKQIMLSGEKTLFIYGGYKVSEVVCGSLIIPFNLVPPNDDGSRVNLAAIPKDSWILCYCP
jgi:hypothetical protein